MQVIERSVDSPLRAWLVEAKTRLGISWEEVAVKSMVSSDQLRRMRDGQALPRVSTAQKLIAAIGDDTRSSDHIMALVTERNAERAAASRSPDAKVGCRGVGCRKTAYLSAVRNIRTFKPAERNGPATFLCRDCQGRPKSLTLICPILGCKSLPRKVYWSTARKAEHKNQRVARSKYEVLCKDHNRSKQGKKQAVRARELIFRRFERLFNARYPSGYVYKGQRKGARDIWTWLNQRIESPAREAQRKIAKRIRGGLLKEAYTDSAMAIFHRFARALKASPSHAEHRTEDLWQLAKGGDPRARRIRAELLHATDEALLRKRWRIQKRSKHSPATTNTTDLPSKRRGKAISKGQTLRRFGRIKGLKYCELCGLLVHRARYHRGEGFCWDVWSRRPGKFGHRPTRPPQPRGRPPEQPDEKYHSIMMSAGGKSLPKIAEAVAKTRKKTRVLDQVLREKHGGRRLRELSADGQRRVAEEVNRRLEADRKIESFSHVAVLKGIESFKDRLPGRWNLVFADRGSGGANRAREEEILRLKRRRVPEREPLILRLAESGMAPEKIADLVGGYEEREVRLILGQPAEEQMGIVPPRASGPADLQVNRFSVARNHPHLLSRNGEVMMRDVVMRDGRVVRRPIALSPRQYALLGYLVSKAGEVIGSAELAASVWRRADGPAGDIVKVTLGHLRKKFKELGDDVVHTVRGAGYRFGPSRGNDPDALERERLLRILTEANQNISLAATRLGVPYSTLHYRLKKHALLDRPA